MFLFSLVVGMTYFAAYLLETMSSICLVHCGQIPKI